MHLCECVYLKRINEKEVMDWKYQGYMYDMYERV